MSNRTLIVKHGGNEYEVTLDVSATYEDDSFDHEFGTEECGHWEIDWDNTSVEACSGPDGDIAPEDVDGLMDAIIDQADQLDLDD